ncbi:hypothetical protein N7494_000498 [Penicillium frequentans]|uniref:GHMP kinase C-terminal domain-containing protein n=1 Tax=Penicillium frequentans TaxID=3151616 RepID=A0AAD6D5X7_9EURO|nr:hypothetical protein N7494_000498 [Penicillium glabrum]
MSPSQVQPKASSPMAPPFIVSAPGKVIVFGEHAVVHRKAAIAAAISLRSYLLVTTLSKSKRTVTLNFCDIDLNHTWNIDSLPWNIFKHPSKKKMYYDPVTELDADLIHQKAAAQFLYLFLSLASPDSHSAIYTLQSTNPISAGLGSSASVSVCLSTALLLQIRILAGPRPDQPPEEAEVQIERINRWTFVGELCIHGNPSGLDNTVSSGGVRSCSNGAAIANHLQSRYHLSFRNCHCYEEDDDGALETFGALFRINHGLLVALGVSHPRLERIRELVDHTNIGWTELTGAGGGGCAITLIRPDALPQTLQNLEEELEAENFEPF